MKIKNKISLGLIFLFSVIVLLGGLGTYYLNQIKADGQAILKDNNESLEYVQLMQKELDHWQMEGKTDFDNFDKALRFQEINVTEIGEKESTLSLRIAFDEFKKDHDPAHMAEMKKALYSIADVNRNAIVRKNDIAQRTAEKATSFLVLITGLCLLLSFSFILNFPSYIAGPIKQLTEGIKQIANKNYEQRIHIMTKDEFGELAEAFNLMAEKLDKYEHSNLAKLLFEKGRIDTIINNMNDAIIGLDEKNNIMFTNQVASQLLGANQNDLVGYYAPDIALKNDLLRSLLQQNEASAPIKIFADNKESYFTKELLEVKIPETNQVAGTVITLKNITKFQELDVAKTNFIATISHELKTPISAIKMSLKLLENEKVGLLNQEQQHLVKHIKDDSERLLKITGELLDLTQVESGKIQLHEQEILPDNIIKFATEAVQTLAEQKQIFFDIQCPENLSKVHADLEKTVWVMVNLLSNAIRYSTDQSKIIIKAEDIGKSIKFWVQDFGKGIDEKFQERIFEKFFQVPNNTKSQYGTGLGLAISKDFIEAQGGNIGVKSELNLGSTFYFSIPKSI
ncbi:PAS domain S-box-containing protein [Pseudarcicella hirudinis]|uniref:histidine kinase n=2 Tax=Pseudarcicella hirudinis TaxID=1079859 RepID=A0A1I5NX21_9BACT|nr:ATP-binding protein [Pseudarcicella hirudinis]SFP26323.1 PAS domain S-box-containing protein [Pseudarcicella hirudinis]